jgi:hypothetical protein
MRELPNKALKLTSAERIARSQLNAGVRRSLATERLSGEA